jgi:hypothetical protein
MKKCKQCKEKFSGEMISNPDLCLSCVIDKHAKSFNRYEKTLIKQNKEKQSE